MNADESSPRGRRFGIAFLLGALTLVLYLGVGNFEFLNYDDPDYVTGNAAVARGLSLDGVRWAFGFHAANWHPLTWLSHMLDVQLFGLEAGPHHLVNAVLHALNAALLFLALMSLTNRPWPSLLVASLFAAHPLRVQSVAWVAERKELLAAAFFFALLLAYARYVRTRSVGAMGVVVLCFLLGCLAKPMLVSAPFVLLLLDVWPLGRLSGPGSAHDEPRRLWLEKLPLFALAAASCVVTLLAQRAGGAVASLQGLSLPARIGGAGLGYLEYLRASVWPSGLAAFYPHPLLVGRSLLVPGLVGVVVVALVSLLAWRERRRAPALFTGWFWFVGMLVPVIGLVQVGDQAWADRYAYLPLIGLSLALVFGLADALRERAGTLGAPGMAGMAGTVAVVALALSTLRELEHWQDSRSLFARALEVTEENWIAHNNLGLVYLERHELDRAKEHFQESARIRPDFVTARFNLANAQAAASQFDQAVATYQGVLATHPRHHETLLCLATLARATGNPEQALAYHEQALEASPRSPTVWIDFGRFLLDRGEVDRASNCAASALRLDPAAAEAHRQLGEIALLRGEVKEAGQHLQRAAELSDTPAVHALLGRWRLLTQDLAGARREFERSILLDPNAPMSRYDFGTLLLRLGERDAARAQFQAVEDLRPDDPQALTALAVMALEDGQAERAIELFETALRAAPELSLALGNLAVAYERTGQWSKAVECYEKVSATASPDPDSACALAWILATGPDRALIDGEKAMKFAALAQQRGAAGALEALAAAHARVGDFEQAVRVQKELVARARQPEQKRALEERLRLFEAGEPYTRPR